MIEPEFIFYFLEVKWIANSLKLQMKHQKIYLHSDLSSSGLIEKTSEVIFNFLESKFKKGPPLEASNATFSISTQPSSTYRLNAN